MKKFLILILITMFVLSGCRGAEAAGYEAELKAQPVTALNENFARGVNDFGFGAAELLYGTNTNLALSPVSIELALAMARAGAAGDTAQQMKNALGLGALSDEQIITACRMLMWRTNTGGMEAANSVWLDTNYNFNEDFINTCLDDFMADAYPLTIPGAMDDINAWVSERTHERIESLLEQEPDAATKLILCNALYYLGEWVLPFDANDTYDEDFNTPSGAVSASFMHSDWSVPYYQGSNFSMISLKFESEDGEGQYAMALMLPAEGTEVADLLAALDGDSFAGALSGLDEQQVDIKLPKFEYTYSTPLAATLTAMGMTDAFDPSLADFSGMTDGDVPLFVSAVLHKCYIRVDELGAEAAAVTAVTMEATSAPMEPLTTFYADRPFIFAIYSVEDGTVAFLGVVNDPTQG